MPKYAEEKTAKIYDAGALLLRRCLIGNGSLFWEGTDLWTVPNFKKLREVFVEHPDTSKRSFIEKFADQIKPAGPDACKLAAEAMAVYFLFLSNVLPQTKIRTIETILSWAGLSMPTDGVLLLALKTEGIGSGGQGYNTRRPNEVEFLIEFALHWKESAEEQQKASAADPWRFMAVIDEVDEASQLRHMLLHILFPGSFERIASGAQKWRVREAFKTLLDSDELDPDRSLAAIRQKLGPLLHRPAFDFYDRDILDIWDATGQFAGGGSSRIDALLYKKQAVLFGPPGTSKTYQAKKFAGTIIREAILEAWGAREYFEKRTMVEEEIKKRTHRLQLHPGWTYDNFVLGLHIDPSGATEYRPGYLLDLVAQITDRLPHVLILDEINRTDLSRMLGEAFSLLENRGEEIELSGQGADGKKFKLKLPENLYLVATMNLIDQSVEQMDFALRRRFLWILCSFDADLFLEAAKERWEQTKAKTQWAAVRSDFVRLAEAAKALNQEIQNSPLLGAQYEIGHTYLLDVVDFLKRELVSKPRTGLWKKGGARTPVWQIWELSLRPLIEEYLAGQDAKERETAISRFQHVFLCPPELQE